MTDMMMPVQGRGLLSAAEHAILVRRLAGDEGAVVGSPAYGGLPLPDAFRAVAEYLLGQNVPVTEDELVKVVSGAGAFPLKEQRVLSAWGSWEAFTRAILLLMRQEKVVTYQMRRGISARGGNLREGGTWALHSAFRPGKPYVLIPDREIGFTAYPPAEKERRNRKDDYMSGLRKIRAGMEADGILLSDMNDAFGLILRRLDKGGFPRKRVHPRTGFENPPQDQPDVMRMCIKCEKDFPLTDQYFSTYVSRGLHYWSREHRGCSPSRHGRVRGGESVSKREVMNAVLKLTGENGSVPSARAVMRLLGRSDDRMIRKYWDDLAAEGRVEPRETRETTW